MEVAFFVDVDTGEISALFMRYSGKSRHEEWLTGMTSANIINLRDNVKATCGELYLCLGKRIDPAKPFEDENIKVLHRLDSLTTLHAR